jgi:hypothetical protein
MRGQLGCGAMDAKTIVELLSQGGWGLSAILMIVIGILWRKIDRLQDRILEMTAKQTEVLTANNLLTAQQTELLDRFLTKNGG